MELQVGVVINRQHVQQLECTWLIHCSVHSVVGWFVSGLGLKLPQPAIQPKNDTEVSFESE